MWLREGRHKVTILQRTRTVQNNKVTYGNLWQGRVLVFIVVF